MFNLLKRKSTKDTKKEIKEKIEIIRSQFEPHEGYRADLDKNFRSKMEANVYRYLTECHPDLRLVEYEPHLFTERDGLPKGFNYLPDFRCTTHEGKQFYIEVAPVMDDRHSYKLGVMKKHRPDIQIEVVNRFIYAKIKRQFAKKTKGWEN